MLVSRSESLLIVSNGILSPNEVEDILSITMFVVKESWLLFVSDSTLTTAGAGLRDSQPLVGLMLRRYGTNKKRAMSVGRLFDSAASVHITI